MKNFYDLKEKVSKVSEEKNDILKKVGLASESPSFEFKIHIFDFLYKKWLKNKWKWINKLLSAINSILGSLAFLGADFSLAEPVKEFKDFLEIGRAYRKGNARLRQIENP